MAIKVPIPLDAPDDALRDFGAGALLRVERATAEAGAYAEIGTVAIVAATFRYEYFDSAGVVTHWYRWRVSNAANTVQSGYADAFQGVDAGQESLPSGSYATLDDALGTHRQEPTGTKYAARLESALREATRDLIREMGGHDYFRHPQTGTETRLFHGTGRDILHVHEGIVSLSQVEIRLTVGGAFVVVPAADWWLEAEPGDLNPAPGEPYFHVRLSSAGSYKIFPKIEQGVRLTLAWGWPEVLPDAREAVVAWGRQKVGWDPSQPGGVPGPDNLEGNPSGDRMPDAVYKLLRAENRRHWCHL